MYLKYSQEYFVWVIYNRIDLNMEDNPLRDNPSIDRFNNAKPEYIFKFTGSGKIVDGKVETLENLMFYDNKNEPLYEAKNIDVDNIENLEVNDSVPPLKMTGTTRIQKLKDGAIRLKDGAIGMTKPFTDIFASKKSIFKKNEDVKFTRNGKQETGTISDVLPDNKYKVRYNNTDTILEEDELSSVKLNRGGSSTKKRRPRSGGRRLRKKSMKRNIKHRR